MSQLIKIMIISASAPLLAICLTFSSAVLAAQEINPKHLSDHAFDYQTMTFKQINIAISELYHAGNEAHSLQLADNVLDNRKDLFEQDSIQLAYFYNNYGTLQMSLGNYDQTEKYYLESIKISEQIVFAEKARVLARSYQRLSKLYGILGNYLDKRRYARLSRKYTKEANHKEQLSQQKLDKQKNNEQSHLMHLISTYNTSA